MSMLVAPLLALLVANAALAASLTWVAHRRGSVVPGRDPRVAPDVLAVPAPLPAADLERRARDASRAFATVEDADDVRRLGG